MLHYFIYILLAIFCSAYLPALTTIIRVFDLGGSGLKTALFQYDVENNSMHWLEQPSQLGKCLDSNGVALWVRSRLQEITEKNLDDEVKAGYTFGFSLAGLNKLCADPLPTSNMARLFNLPSDRTRCIDDGAANLVASLNTPELHLPQGPIWNFSIGTHPGWGFTDSKHRVRNLSDFWHFFDGAPWHVIEPTTGNYVMDACGGRYGLDQIMQEHNGVASDEVFIEFGERWKSYIQRSILEYSTKICPGKSWGTPAAIVFTGGVIDYYEEALHNTLFAMNLDIPIFKGPKHAALLGAAWNTVNNPFGKTPLIRAIAKQDFKGVKKLILDGADVNQKDAHGNIPLMAAIQIKSHKMVKLLVKNGADVNVFDYSGQTPLCAAARAKKSKIAHFLAEHGADKNVVDFWGRSIPSLQSKLKEI